MNYLLVFIGGGLGSLLRYFFSVALHKTNFQLPIATLCANTLSCLIFGVFVYIYEEKHLIPEPYKHLVLIGICGGLSTFSTFSYETFELVKQGLTAWAIINIVVSCALCTTLFFIFSK